MQLGQWCSTEPSSPPRNSHRRSSSGPDRSDRKGVVVKRSLCLVVAVSAVCAVSPVDADQVDHVALQTLTSKYDFAIQYGSASDNTLKFLYVDNNNHIHVYRLEDERFQLDWEQTNLGTRVTSIFITPLYGDGRPMLVVSTLGGRILVYDMDGYDLEWENLQDPFDMISYMVAENLDGDPQEELVFVATDKLVIYDSLNKTFEWVSQYRVAAQQIKLSNMDDDPQLEIVLNTGVIIDSKFYNIEFEADRPFGPRIQLFDMNGDGIPEIWGESQDQILRVFDRYSEREVW